MGEIRKTIGANIKKVCALKGIRQVEIAEKLGVSPGTVSNWFKGTNSIDIENLAALCDFLGVSLDQIYGVAPLDPPVTLSQDETEEQGIRRLLSEKLREFRLKAGMTAKEVGAQIGKSEKTVSGWEHGRGQPDADMLFKLCEIYNVASMSDFYTAEPPVRSGSLSPNEAELLSIYRSVNKEGKATLMNVARSVATNSQMQEGPI